MKRGEILILALGIGLAIASTLARLSIPGWLFLYGLLSVLLFGAAHALFLHQVSRHYYRSDHLVKGLLWLGILSFPVIFLFQYDFEDSDQSFYVYEYLTGKGNSSFESYGFLVSVAAAIVYLVNLWVVRRRIKRQDSYKKEKAPK